MPSTLTAVQPTFDVLTTIENQARSCEHLGSPLYGRLLSGIADDYRRGGVSRALLDEASVRPDHDAVALRYVAAGHRLALAGEAPGLARHYPSCGGRWTGEDPTPDFLDLVHARTDAVRDGLRRQVQTNEVGRAVVLACGIVAASAGLPVRLLELGASAGLLSRLPWYRIDTGRDVCGPDDSPVRFGADWFEGEPPALPRRIDVVEQGASDLSPIDVSTPAGYRDALSFLWPDQDERIERMRAALAVATEHPLRVDRADAGDWLAARLAADLPHGVATIVFHSIVWQYLPDTTRAAVRAALVSAGARAGRRAPLAWLRMEPATRQHADLRLTRWPGGDDVVLAEVGYHGRGVRWLG